MSKSSVKPRATIIWSEQTAKLKRKFATITDRDLNFEKGKLEEMLSRLQEKMGKSKHELYDIITKI
ncbi:MAG TPA: general stress protein CsbD [Bacteroidales bacterium]|nr:general stress protein CsbD [Bacteroidales bacterium]